MAMVNFLLVGLGSIGRKHLTSIHHYYPNSAISVIDPVYAVGEHSLQSISFLVKPQISPPTSSNDVAVIANWGPDHFKTFIALVDAGFKRILIEKPLADSLHELHRIREICHNNKIVMSVNHSWHFEGLASRILSKSDSLTLGAPVMLTTHGGARCLSTSGSHVIHLANQLFASTPQTISGLGQSDFINPRNASLAFYEGVFSFYYPGNRLLSISYSNSSSVAGANLIYWKNAIGYLEEETIRIYERPRKRDFASVITRYGEATELLFEGKLPVIEDRIYRDVYDFLVRIEFPDSIKNLNEHLVSSDSLIQAILASRLGIHTAPAMPHSDDLTHLKLGIS
jgi:predicted dehydrogenase